MSKQTQALGKPIKHTHSSKQVDFFAVFVLVFVSIFVGLTVLTGLSLIHRVSIVGIVFFIGLEVLFIGIAYDLAEGLLALLVTPERLPKCSPLREFPPVALLITVCDDVIPEVLKRLQFQTYPNYDIFVLDDSSDESQHVLVDQFGYTVLRRGTRRAFKAGNINNWLDKYGLNYEYFVVLDSDSVISPSFITRMVEYAEHPQNEHTAVFQSKIMPWNKSSFPRILGTIKPLRHYILERVANRTGMLLAYGQNNLNRTDCILQVGGFHEGVTAEDTTLALMLSTKGYSVKLVDILSYNTEPQNVFYYARQITRWAAQTVELFHLPWQSVAFRLKLRLCYDLYRYLIQSVLLVLFLIAAWTFKAENWLSHDWLTSTINNQVYQHPWFLMSLAVINLWGLQFILHLVLVKKSGISLRNYLLYALLLSTLMYFVIVPVDIAMLRTALGAGVQFNSTNRRLLHMPTLSAILSRMWPSTVCGGLFLAGMIFRNQYLVLSLNSLWLMLLLVAPLVLWLFHTDSKGLREEANEL